ncbi:MAG: hypothetical protein M1827_006866 [Pycnora praestabilis]|nr:MAG: hypothetical protein M1827_006866 [Pycnora praestabilis]
MKSFIRFVAAISFITSVTASPTPPFNPHWKRQNNTDSSQNSSSSSGNTGGVNCPAGFRNAVFNTDAPSQPNWPGRFDVLQENGVANWIGFTVNPVSETATYGNPPSSAALDNNQIKIVMNPNDIPNGIDLIQSANPPAYLEIFNEPDFSYADATPLTSPQDAASAIVPLLKAWDASNGGKTTLISPAVAFTGSSWLPDFFSSCESLYPGCSDKFPIISGHIYKASASDAIAMIQGLSNSFPGKDLWLTELAPSSSPNAGSTQSGGEGSCTMPTPGTPDAPGVVQWMQEVLTFCAGSGYVKKVFWNTGEWSGDFGATCNPSLTNNDGSSSATAVLEAYNSFCA